MTDYKSLICLGGGFYLKSRVAHKSTVMSV